MEDKEKKDSIEKIKEKHAILKKKYSLPEWNELNREFGIEKIDEDSEFILREIIHLIADRIQNYMRFIENILNPSNASIFTFSLVKLIDEEKRKKLSENYKKISEIELKLIKLDLNATEENEAEFIEYSFKSWKLIKKDLYELITFIEDNWESKPEQTKKDYFG